MIHTTPIAPPIPGQIGHCGHKVDRLYIDGFRAFVSQVLALAVDQ